MPGLRKDYITDTWVVFSTVRSKRPGEFKFDSRPTPPEKCPFCIGHEHMTPPEILAYRKEGAANSPGWGDPPRPRKEPAPLRAGARPAARAGCLSGTRRIHQPGEYPALSVEGEVRRHVSQLFHSVN